MVQVGDLVHRGPDSEGVIGLVDGYLRRQPDQWVQLVGNHEAQYLRDPAFAWSPRLDAATADVLRRWWADGRMRVAAAITGHGGGDGDDILVTHAGLTAAFWREDLGAPEQVSAAAVALNALADGRDDVLFRPGQMLGSGRPVARAGPIWASARGELVASWLGVAMPFSQIHGHSSVFDGAPRRDAVIAITTVDPDSRHETSTLDGGRIIGIDPGHGVRPQRAWRAWQAQDVLVG